MSQIKVSSLVLAVKSFCGDKAAAAAILSAEVEKGVANILKHGNDKPMREAAAAALQAKGSIAPIVAPLLTEFLNLRKAKDIDHAQCDELAAEKAAAFIATVNEAVAAAAAVKKAESEVKKAAKETAAAEEKAAADAETAAAHAEELAAVRAGRTVSLADVLAFIQNATHGEVATIGKATAEAAAAWATIEAAHRATIEAAKAADKAAAAAANEAAAAHNAAAYAAIGATDKAASEAAAAAGLVVAAPKARKARKAAAVAA